MKILINVPSLDRLGGVANHYLGLRNFWSERVQYNTVGRRGSGNRNGVFWLPWDIVKFIFRLFVFRPDVILINPSLGVNALKRDFFFLNLACLLRFKVAVFIHGFDWNCAKTIDREWVVTNLNKASLILLLAESFRKELRLWGVSAPIVLTTTKVDDQLLKDFKISSRTGTVKNLLFLARLVKNKGIYETIETYNILKKKYPFLSLTIVGEGSESSYVKKHVKTRKLPDIRITGNLTGENLINAFKDTDLYLLPSYGEGMPTSVLEAMAFGQPVFTRYVGGLSDFFENGKMGYITDSLNPADFADAIIPFLESKDLALRVSRYNHQYAKTHFMASRVARTIEKQLKQIER